MGDCAGPGEIKSLEMVNDLVNLYVLAVSYGKVNS